MAMLITVGLGFSDFTSIQNISVDITYVPETNPTGTFWYVGMSLNTQYLGWTILLAFVVFSKII